MKRPQSMMDAEETIEYFMDQLGFDPKSMPKVEQKKWVRTLN